MTETIKEKLANAEFWTCEAKNWFDHNEEQHAKLKQADELIREVIREMFCNQ